MSLFGARSTLVILPEPSGFVVLSVGRAAGGLTVGEPKHMALPEGDDVHRGRLFGEWLKEQGLTETGCVVALPPGWTVAQLIDVPQATPDGDRMEFLMLELDGRLPFELEDVLVTFPRLPGKGKGGHALAVVTPRRRVAGLRVLLEAAGLRKIVFCPAVEHIETDSEELRTVFRLDGDRGIIQVQDALGPLLWREVVLPERDEVFKSARVGLNLAIAGLPDAYRLRLKMIELESEDPPAENIVRTWTANSEGELAAVVARPFGEGTRAIARTAASVSLQDQAACGFGDAACGPAEGGVRISRQVRAVGLAVLAALALILALPANQYLRSRALKSRLAELQPTADAAVRARDEIRRLQPWFATRPVSLDILQTVTAAFPERGTVWVTRFSIDSEREVTVSGAATDIRDWMAALDAVRKDSAVSDLRISQTRKTGDGNTPMTFKITFLWRGGLG